MLLSSAAGKTRAELVFMGKCAVIATGQSQRTVERRARVTPVAIVIASLLAGAGVFFYAMPYIEADVSMKAGTVLLAAGGAVYGIPASQQTTSTAELPPKPAHRYLGMTECPVRPIVDVHVLLRDSRGDREGVTDRTGVVELDGALAPDTRVYVDGQIASDVVRQ